MYGNFTYSQGTYASKGALPDVEVSVIGASANVTLNSVEINTDQLLSVTGLSATATLNNDGVIVVKNESVHLTSLIGSSEITSSLVWGEIDQSQTPNWTEIKD
tara:strand:- start:15 stop:323 length:309 start_codon:yes stop_codon:yes gene_type:complete